MVSEESLKKLGNKERLRLPVLGHHVSHTSLTFTSFEKAVNE